MYDTAKISSPAEFAELIGYVITQDDFEVEERLRTATGLMELQLDQLGYGDAIKAIRALRRQA